MSYGQVFPLAAPNPSPQPSPYRVDLSVRLICRQCKNPVPNIIEQFASGDLVCGDCGLVLGDRIVDTRSEWRTFANDEGDDPSRVGAAIDPYNDGIETLETAIAFKDGHSGLSRDLQRAAARAFGGNAARGLPAAFRIISTLCDSWSFPKTVCEIAKQLYKRSDEEKLLKGKSLDAIAAACIFIACRQARVPRTFREICQLTRVPKKIVGQCYKVLEQAFNLSPVSDAATHAGRPEHLLSRICNRLDLPMYVESMASDIIRLAREHGVADGRSPVSISAGAIYFAAHLLGSPLSAKAISAVAGVTDSTIKIIYRLYYAQKEKLVKNEWRASGRADMSRLPNNEGNNSSSKRIVSS